MPNPSLCDPLVILKQQVRGGVPLTIDQACHLLEAVDAYREVVDQAQYQ